MIYLIAYMIPGILWLVIRKIIAPIKKPFKRLLMTIIGITLLYPLIFLSNYFSYLRMRRYLKPFKKWKFIFLREVELIKSKEEYDQNKNQ